MVRVLQNGRKWSGGPSAGLEVVGGRAEWPNVVEGSFSIAENGRSHYSRARSDRRPCGMAESGRGPSGRSGSDWQFCRMAESDRGALRQNGSGWVDLRPCRKWSEGPPAGPEVVGGPYGSAGSGWGPSDRARIGRGSSGRDESGRRPCGMAKSGPAGPLAKPEVVGRTTSRAESGQGPSGRVGRGGEALWQGQK